MTPSARQARSPADTTLPWLVLSLPEEPFASCTHGPFEPTNHPVTVPDEAHRPLYRWILGHHGAVCVWRLLQDALIRPDGGEAASVLFDAYSALLLYAGSCTRDAYHAVIRARMRERDEAFSGTWARDNEAMRAVQRRQERPARASPLRRAMLFNNLVHMTVARRLVPDDKSLLRASSRDPHAPTNDVDRALFDDFFMVRRQALCRHEFAAQFAYRLELIRADLAACPVDVEYQQAEVTEFGADLAVHLKLSTVVDDVLLG